MKVRVREPTNDDPGELLKKGLKPVSSYTTANISEIGRVDFNYRDTHTWPRTFKSASDAVSWADGFLSRPNLKSQMGEIARSKTKTRQITLDSAGQVITKNRLINLAETISVCLSDCERPAAALYRHVWGRYPCTWDTADQLAHIVDGGTRELALLLIERKRRRAHTWGIVTAKDIAEAMGLTRTKYYELWGQQAKEMKDHINMWLERTDRAMDDRLRDVGIL